MFLVLVLVLEIYLISGDSGDLFNFWRFICFFADKIENVRQFK